MIIRRCTIEDIDEIYKIEETAFSDPLKKETMEKDLAGDSYFCYALFEDSAKAFVSFEKVFDEGQIISVATLPECRKKGFARKLFNHVTSCARDEGIKLFTLEVRRDNYPATGLYKSLGFIEVGVRKNYYKNPTCDAILMDLHLEKE